jgi:hypothetical protein
MEMINSNDFFLIFLKQISKRPDTISFIPLVAKMFVILLIFFYAYQYKQMIGSSTFFFGQYMIGLSTKEEVDISLTYSDLHDNEKFHCLKINQVLEKCLAINTVMRDNTIK